MATSIIDAISSLRPGAKWILRGGDISGLEWLDEVQTAPTQVEIDAELLNLQEVLPQAMIAQFTPDDMLTVQTAISADNTKLLLWYSFLAQRDPMKVGNARFRAGWDSLVQTLGQQRMDAIATALGITIPA